MALSLPINSPFRSHIGNFLPCVHSSSASLRYQFPAVFWGPFRWRDSIKQTRACAFACSPINKFWKSSARPKASDEKMGAVIRSGLNPCRALSGSSDEAASVQPSAINHRARFMVHSKESCVIEELERPLSEYMSLPASQYSVLDAERIVREDENTFKCYVYRFKFFAFEVCPVLLVRVEEQPNGCRIRLLSCKLEGSPIVVAQNEKFSASMVNEVSYSFSDESSTARQLISETTIEVIIDIPFAFRPIPVEIIESTGNQVLQQLLKLMLPRFLSQLSKDYKAWATGDTSRRPLGTGQI